MTMLVPAVTSFGEGLKSGLMEGKASKRDFSIWPSEILPFPGSERLLDLGIEDFGLILPIVLPKYLAPAPFVLAFLILKKHAEQKLAYIFHTKVHVFHSKVYVFH